MRRSRIVVPLSAISCSLAIRSVRSKNAFCSSDIVALEGSFVVDVGGAPLNAVNDMLTLSICSWDLLLRDDELDALMTYLGILPEAESRAFLRSALLGGLLITNDFGQ
jgi:hypothetical protein